MKSLEFLNQLPRPIIDNFNRDSSACESAAGFVIHSAVHRSTVFISKAEHPEGAAAVKYWRTAGREALNGFVEATVAGLELEACNLEAFRRSRPGWTVSIVGAAGATRSRLFTARRASGGSTASISAYSLPHLHRKTA